MAKSYIIAFAGALVLSLVSTRAVRDWAQRRGLLSKPNSRDVHQVPVPRLGGVAIYFTVLLVAFIFALVDHFGVRTQFDVVETTMLLIPATMVFMVGVYDDLRGASPYLKLGIQLLAALVLFGSGFRVLSTPVIFGGHHLGVIASFAITSFWIVLITNAFNLIDGLDGLAAGSALFTNLTLFILCLLSGNGPIAVLAVIMAGATFGFLRFNFSPASIFLGDGGSLFLGFMLAAFSLGGKMKGPTIVAVAIPVVSFGLPLVEVAVSIGRRLISGRPLFDADREHIHHKLLDIGMTQRQVAALLYGICALFALLSLFLMYPAAPIVGLILAIVAVGTWTGLQRLGYREMTEITRIARRTIEQKEVVRNNLAIRRTADELRHVRDLAVLQRLLESCFCENEFDGFRLEVEGLETGAPNSAPLCFEWSRQPLQSVRWSLQLHLKSETTAGDARFTLYRSQESRPLLIDVNVICSGFQDALSAAVSRVVEIRPGVRTVTASSGRD